MNLHQKLVEVRKDIGGFTKDKKSFNYEYVSGSQVLAKIQTKMNELGVLLMPSVKDQFFKEHPYKDKFGKDKLDFIVHGSMEYKWINAEDPTDEIIVPFYYTGQQDDISKAFGSGLTYSERYFIIKFFNLPTDADDPDARGVTPPKENKPVNQKPAATSSQTTNGTKMITDPQIKAIGTKTGIIGKSTGVEQRQVYISATKHLKIDKSTRELTAEEAGKVISYLSTLE